jgi:hypothetical protein
MHIVIYFFVVGTALLALLFYADAKMEPRGPLAINNEFVGLPAPWHGPAAQNLASTPAPSPDMNSEAVLAAAPPASKPGAVAAATNAAGSEQTAKAEIAPKKKKHIARRAPQPEDGAPRYAWRNGGDGPFGGLFGRF